LAWLSIVKGIIRQPVLPVAGQLVDVVGMEENSRKVVHVVLPFTDKAQRHLL